MTQTPVHRSTAADCRDAASGDHNSGHSSATHVSARPRIGGVLLGSLLVALAVWALQTPSEAGATAAAAQQEGGLITLFQHDAIASSVDFVAGTYGAVVAGGEVQLGNAQLVYGGFESGLLSYGFGADESAHVFDLGDGVVHPTGLAQDAALKFPISFFSTLAINGRRLVFQPAGGVPVRLDGGSELLGVPGRGLRHVEPLLGHCYVMRAQRTRGDRRDLFFKFQVVEHRVGESVTLRWAPLGT